MATPRTSGAARSRGQARNLANVLSVLTVISLASASLLFLTARLAVHYGAMRPFTLPGLPNLIQPVSANDVAYTEVDDGSTASTTADGIDLLEEFGIGLSPAQARVASPRVRTFAARQKPSGIWLPIMMYHYVRHAPAGDTAGYSLSVTPEALTEQMQYLKDHGYTPVTMHDAVLILAHRMTNPGKPIALTFDDGYRDFYTAGAPILRSFGFTATDYVPTQLVGGVAYMTWPMIKELDTQGFEMAGHSQMHVALAAQSEMRAKMEIEGSKADLENNLAHPVYDFAYPYGSYSDWVVRMVRDAGWVSATTTNFGGWHDSTQMLVLSRIRAGGGQSLANFAGSIAQPSY